MTGLHSGWTFEEWRQSLLKNPKEAAAYLEEYLRKEDCDTPEEHLAMLAEALRNIGLAHGVRLVTDKKKA